MEAKVCLDHGVMLSMYEQFLCKVGIKMCFVFSLIMYSTKVFA